MTKYVILAIMLYFTARTIAGSSYFDTPKDLTEHQLDLRNYSTRR